MCTNKTLKTFFLETSRWYRKNILVYFGLILVIFIFSWMAFVMIEPDTTWASNTDHKLIDSASAIAATLNNIGPGLGIVGPKQNYGHFSWASKLLFTWLMMLGRLEIFVILVTVVSKSLNPDAPGSANVMNRNFAK